MPARRNQVKVEADPEDFQKLSIAADSKKSVPKGKKPATSVVKKEDSSDEDIGFNPEEGSDEDEDAVWTLMGGDIDEDDGDEDDDDDDDNFIPVKEEEEDDAMEDDDEVIVLPRRGPHPQAHELEDELDGLHREYLDLSDSDYDPNASRDDYEDDREDDRMDNPDFGGRPDVNEIKTELAELRQDLKDDNVLVLARAALANIHGEDRYRLDDEDEDGDDEMDESGIEDELAGLRDDLKDENVMVLARAAVENMDQRGRVKKE
ncbi:hypothetical protein V8E36_004578 [Tilletia maclaganii]